MKEKDTVVRNKDYHCLEYDHDQMGDIFLVACGQEVCDPGVTYGPDLRDCYHLHIVRSGCGVLRADGKIFHPHAGQMFLLKHKEVVEYTADRKDPWSYCWVTFNGSEARRIVEEIGFTEGIYLLSIETPPEDFFDLIRRMHTRPEMTRVNELFRRGVMLEYLSMAMEASPAAMTADDGRNHRPVEDYIDCAAQFIHYNYQTITVGDVVNFIGFSRGYLTTAFRRAKGISLQEYLLRVRMQKAKELILSTNLQIQEIAEKVGYSDQLNFSRIFRKYEGICPSDYRNKMRNGNGKEN